MVPSSYFSLYVKYVLHFHYDMVYIFALAQTGTYGMFIDSITF
jgi:hypothetical protein